jgi:hypothetical protein
MMHEKSQDELWVPDNPDGSGWASIDWTGVVRGRKYFYRHAEPDAEARALRPAWYRVVTRLDTPLLHAPHENSYYVSADEIADFLAEVILAGGNEVLWRIDPIDSPPPESNATTSPLPADRSS